MNSLDSLATKYGPCSWPLKTTESHWETVRGPRAPTACPTICVPCFHAPFLLPVLCVSLRMVTRRSLFLPPVLSFPGMSCSYSLIPRRYAWSHPQIGVSSSGELPSTLVFLFKDHLHCVSVLSAGLQSWKLPLAVTGGFLIFVYCSSAWIVSDTEQPWEGSLRGSASEGLARRIRGIQREESYLKHLLAGVSTQVLLRAKRVYAITSCLGPVHPFFWHLASWIKYFLLRPWGELLHASQLIQNILDHP